MESSDSEDNGSDPGGDNGFPSGFFHQAGTHLPHIQQVQIIDEDGNVEYMDVDEDEDLVQLFQQILSQMDEDGVEAVQTTLVDEDYNSEDDSDYSEGDDGSLDTDLDYTTSEEDSDEEEKEDDDPIYTSYCE